MLIRDRTRGSYPPVRRRRACLSTLRSLTLVLLTLCAATAAPARSFDGRTADPAAGTTWPAGIRSALAAQAQPLMTDGSRSLQSERLAGRTAPDSLFAAVLMCDFADSLFYGRHGQVPGDFPPPAQSDFYYLAHDSTFYHHQMRDVQAYFDAVSGGRFTFAFEVIGTVANMPHTMGWYGNHPDEGEQKVLLARDTVAALDGVVDFSRYDTVVLIHAGAGEETDILGDSPEQIYSSYLGPETFAEAHEEEVIPAPWLLTGDAHPDDSPVTIDQVLVLPENEFQDSAAGGGYFGSLGVYCFEVGLRLGMLSLSDFTPSGHPDSQGIGEFGLMGYGLFVGAGFIPAHPCAFNKMLMGWLEPYPVVPEAGDVHRLYAAEYAAGDSVLARVEIGPSEYWLLEYRQQDPDGNGIFSFPGDLNGNNVPDYFDADSDSLDGTPTSWYDPSTDQREWLFDAEFDFFMSENDARTDSRKGAGSGLYVWHVDEGVIRSAFLSGENLFNADPARKAVDLEEADGIQDLDRRIPSAWVLGADYDSYRGEDVNVFGPDTSPATETAGGVPTGILIDMISNVVVDSTHVNPGFQTPVIRYAGSMTFRCSRSDVGVEGAPEPVAALQLDGVDLTGGHLLAADLDGSGDGVLEIVTTGAGGLVLAYTHDLQPFLWGTLQPGLFAVGKGPGGEPVTWNGPAAVGDVDLDGLPEVILTAASGLYVFNGEDGSELLDGDGDRLSDGLVLPLERCDQPPVVAAMDLGGGQRDAVILVERRFSDALLRVHHWNPDETAGHVLTGTDLAAAAPPVRRQGKTLLPVRDESDGAWYLADIAADMLVALPGEPSGLLPLAAEDVLVLPAAGGSAAHGAPPDEPLFGAWPAWADVTSPLSPGLAYVSGSGFVLAGVDGFPLTGWPVAPRIPVRAAVGAAAPSPLVAEIDGSIRHLFASRDGRLFLYDRDGRLEPGWPLAGPGETAGTPLLMDLDGDPDLELVAAGAIVRISGYDDAGEPAGEPVSRLAVWTLPGTAGAVETWPMWGGSPGRTATAGAILPPFSGSGLLASDSHICYPAPLIGTELHVRALVNGVCQVRAYLYNLEGEEVRASQSVQAHGGPVEVLLDVEAAVSGMYICRLIAENGDRREVSVRPVVIAR